MDKNKEYYRYSFSNFEAHTMTPIEAHKYANRLKIDILQGPGYVKGTREKAFTGWGWHDSLQMSFKGPHHYKTYLKANGLVEAGVGDRPIEKDLKKPVWDEELIRKAINHYGMEIGSVMADALLSGELDYPDDTHYPE